MVSTLDDARIEALAAGVDAMGVDVPANAQAAMLRYLDLLARWNRIYNLTAIREPERMVSHHLLDSLAAIRPLERRFASEAAPTLLDVGSGAGLPGIPLAIARPSWQVTMVEPVHKKASFIAQAIAELRLVNARIDARRVEDHRPSAPYHAVISRAFSDLATFACAAAPHLAAGGVGVAMKGLRPDEEIAELPAEFVVDDDVKVDVPGVGAARHLLLLARASP